jgi:CRP/FNR family transcriptional regulator
VSVPIELLRQVGLFGGLSDRDLKRLLDTFKESVFEPGATIATEGERGVGFFIIAEGTVEYSLDGKKIGTGGPGDYFGEIALIDDGPRTATIVALTEVKAYGMTMWEFRPLVEEEASIAWELLQVMARRLRAAGG